MIAALLPADRAGCIKGAANPQILCLFNVSVGEKQTAEDASKVVHPWQDTGFLLRSE